MSNGKPYQEIQPSKDLDHLVHSFWTHKNVLNEPEVMTIIPDSFFKIIFLVSGGEITKYFMTGLWTENREFVIAPKTVTLGCRLRILAPEYLIGDEVKSILNGIKQLDFNYLNINKFELSNFNLIVEQWQQELRQVKLQKPIDARKLRLSRLIYQAQGAVTATEVSKQVYWTNRQINRYLDKYLGVSLKKYLNMQKCYASYVQIRNGEFYPKLDYYDQAHFIRQIKQFTGETPSKLFASQNDRFIQLKNIQEK